MIQGPVQGPPVQPDVMDQNSLAQAQQGQPTISEHVGMMGNDINLLNWSCVATLPITFVYCHLTSCCENFQCCLSTLAATAPSPPQPFLTIVPIPTLTLPEKLANFMDMMAMIVT